MPESAYQDDRAGPAPAAPLRSPPAHRLMFVVLSFVAFGLFAATVLAPVLDEYCALRTEETRLTKRNAGLEAEVRRRADMTEAFAHDEVINERLAILDLHYRRLNEEVLPVFTVDEVRQPSAKEQTPATSGPLVLPKSWPDWAHRARGWANDYALIGLFLDARLRPVFLLMSAGLIVAAFVLFAPISRTRRHPPARGSPASDGAAQTAD